MGAGVCLERSRRVSLRRHGSDVSAARNASQSPTSSLISLAPVTSRLTIAIDTGGTFTDCVYRIGGRIEVLKLPSTPDDPSRAILEAVRRIARLVPPATIEVRHGTTVATNALLERKGARVAFVTTAGFEDTLAIARQARPNLYDWNQHRPAPITDLCFGVPERIGPDGSVLLAPTNPTLDRTPPSRSATSNAESIAVSLLFSFANPAHEQADRQAHSTLSACPSRSRTRSSPNFANTNAAAPSRSMPISRRACRATFSPLERGLAKRSATTQHHAVLRRHSLRCIRRARTRAHHPLRPRWRSHRRAQRRPHRRHRSHPHLRHGWHFDRRRSSRLPAQATSRGATRTTDTAKARSQDSPSASPCSTSTPPAQAAAHSRGWTPPARFRSVRSPPEPIPAPPATAAANTPPSPTPTSFSAVCIPTTFSAAPCDSMRSARAKRSPQSPTKSFATLEHLAEGILRVANARMESALRRVSVERGHDPAHLHAACIRRRRPAPRLRSRRVARHPPRSHSRCSRRALRARHSRCRPAPRVLAHRDARARLAADRQGLSRTRIRSARQHSPRRSSRRSCSRSADLRYHGQGFELRVDWSANAVARFHQPARAILRLRRSHAPSRDRHSPRPGHRPLAQTAHHPRSASAKPDARHAQDLQSPHFRRRPLAQRRALRSRATPARQSHHRPRRHHRTQRHHVSPDRLDGHRRRASAISSSRQDAGARR